MILAVGRAGVHVAYRVSLEEITMMTWLAAEAFKWRASPGLQADAHRRARLLADGCRQMTLEQLEWLFCALVLKYNQLDLDAPP
jgi:hypothetical protein